jgi:DNA-binding CsgD family transcriptional regulator
MVYRQLTDRQGAVGRLLCAGKTTQETAAELGVTPMAVMQHRYWARLRCGRITIAELCRMAAEDTPLP